MHARSWRSFVVTTCLIGLSPALAALPLGVELQVNSHTTHSQYNPASALLPDGGFVVIWSSYDQESTDRPGVFGQRFDSVGTKLGTEFQVNTYTPDYQEHADVAVNPTTGDFVVVWQSRNGQDGDGRGVFAQRFTSAGARVAAEFQVNTTTTGIQRYPVVAIDAEGDFVVAWGANSPDVFGDVHGQRFASSGDRLGAEFLINSYTGILQFSPEIAMESDGDFIVVWTSESDGDDSFGVRGQRFDSAGAMLGTELHINSHTAGPQAGQAVAVDGDGDFVVVWTSSDETFSDSEIIGQRFASTGGQVGGEFQVNTATSGYQYTTRSNWVPRAVAMDSDGDFVVAWTNYVGEDAVDLLAQRFTSDGNQLGGELQINEHTPDGQYYPAVAMDGGGDFLVVWESWEQDGDLLGVFGRRFAFQDAALDIDGNGALDALTDGLLLLSRLFGFSGPTLVDGAVGDGCTRCESAEVESHVAANLTAFDIDDSGETGPLSDGLLVLRDLFGFDGATLVAGAIEDDCVRCEAEEIETYLDTLK